MPGAEGKVVQMPARRPRSKKVKLLKARTDETDKTSDCVKHASRLSEWGARGGRVEGAPPRAH